MIRRAALVAITLLLLTSFLPAPSASAAFDPARGLVLKGTLVTMDDDGTILEDGRMLVRGQRIVALWQGDTPPAGVDVGDAMLVDLGADARIFPGLVNLHGHPAYDVLPLWLAPSSHAQPLQARPTGAEPYANRYQWNSAGDELPEYRRLVSNPRVALTSGNALDLGPEVIKWAEAMSALGGQTTFQGDGVSYAETDHSLVRNVDLNAFCEYRGKCVDRVDSRVPSIALLEPGSFDHVTLAAYLWLGGYDAWLVHLAEGVRDDERPQGDKRSSRAEFDQLVALGLLTDRTVVVHGNALSSREFALMAHAPGTGTLAVGGAPGAKLVWSPLSNLVLYGQTANVYEAMAEGVLVSLGTDWTPSGSRNLLDEIKIADIALRDPRVLGDDRALFPGDDRALDEALVAMVTRNPAKTIGAFDRIGSLEPGKLADIMVLGKPTRAPTGDMPDSAYRDLIDATERDVRLVLIDGEPVAGDVAAMQLLKPDDHEVVTSARGGYAKAIDVTDPAVPGGTQTLAEVEAALRENLTALGGDAPPAEGGPAPATNTYRHLKLYWDHGNYSGATNATFLNVLRNRMGTTDGMLNLEAIDLNPLLVEDDAHLFAALAGTPASPLPYGPYPSNANHIGPLGNPLATPAFEARWYG